jgi:putative spermidine/putrescine transport system substrate-binding protein
MRAKPVLVSMAAAMLAIGLVACSSSGSAEGGSGSASGSSASNGSGGASSGASGSASGSSSGSASASGSGSASAASGTSGSASGSSGSATSGSGSGGSVDCGPATSLNMLSDGDTNIQNLWEQTLLPAFAKACPDIKVNFTFDVNDANETTNLAKMAGAQKSNKPVPYDVLEGIGKDASVAGLTMPVTTAMIPNMANVNQTAVKQVNSTAVPWRGSAVLLAYDSSKIKTPPKTLADLLTWIKANPGKFTYNDPSGGGSGDSFVQTVLASKTPAADLTKMVNDYVPDLEKDWDAGFAILKDIKADLYQGTSPHGNNDVLNYMAQGVVEMAPVWSDQFLTAQSTGQIGDEWKVTQTSDPSMTGGPAYMAIVKGTKQATAAAALINFMLEPAQQAQVVKTIAGFPAIPLTSLPSDAQSSFAGIDTQDLRTGLNGKMDNDMKQQWTAKVG